MIIMSYLDQRRMAGYEVFSFEVAALYPKRQDDLPWERIPVEYSPSRILRSQGPRISFRSGLAAYPNLQAFYMGG